VSRYVRVELGVFDKPALRAALATALPGITIEEAAHAGERVMLEGSLECAGEPVDLRMAAGVGGTVEDFGFVLEPEGGACRLICGEYDRRLLEAELLPPLRQALAVGRVRAAAGAAGLELEERVEADGTRRIRVRERL